MIGIDDFRDMRGRGEMLSDARKQTIMRWLPPKIKKSIKDTLIVMKMFF